MRRWVLGEFTSSEALLACVRALRERGFRRLDLYSPFPLEEAPEALGLPPSRIGWVALAAGLGGALFAYVAQGFTNAVDWPLIVGSRPMHAAPAFIPITFELGVLSASGAIFFGLLALFGFPRVAHPVFELEAFKSATSDGFWVSVTFDGADPEVERALEALRTLGARQVSVLEEPA